MKKRVVLGILGFSAAFCCISLGYAAWTITGSMTGEASGNFQAYDLTDDGDVTVQLCNPTGDFVENENIIFGKPATPNTFDNKWFDFSNDMDTEVLDAYIKVTFEKNGDFPTGGITFDVTHELQSRANSTAEYAVNTTQTYIATPTISKQSSSDENITFSANSITFNTNGYIVLKLAYDWTLEDNPYNYYNSLPVSIENREAAYNYIHGLYELTGSDSNLVRFVVKIKLHN